MRRFKLVRTEDISGVSGLGEVAEGAQFHDGQCCLAWFSTHHAMAIYPTINDIIDIHGHEGRTTVKWEDD